MEIEAIGTDLSSESAQLSQQSSLSQSDFIRLFLTQLTYQDPLEPVDNSEFLAQMAQFSVVEQGRETNKKLDSVLVIGSIDQAVSLVGKTVRFDNGSRKFTGEVSNVSFNVDGPSLTINMKDGKYIDGISLSDVSVVTNL